MPDLRVSLNLSKIDIKALLETLPIKVSMQVGERICVFFREKWGGGRQL